MRTELFIACMLIGLQTGYSQSDTIALKEVTVLGQRSPELYARLIRMVEVIPQKELINAPSISLPQLLERLTNVDIRQRGAPGVQADLNIMGGSFDQSLILLNGVRFSDPQTGHHNFNLPVDAESVYGIEMLSGSVSRVLGTNAFSGAVNFKAGVYDSTYFRVSLSAGQYGLLKAVISGALNGKHATHFLSVHHQSSTGFTENTDYRISGFYYRGSVDLDPVQLEYQAGHQEKAFGANSFYTPLYPNQFEQTKASFGSLKLTTGNRVKVKSTVYLRRLQDRFELFRNDPASWYKGHNYHLTYVYGTEVNTWFSTRMGTTSLGFDLHADRIRSNVLGIPAGDTLKVPGEPNGVFTKGEKRKYASLYAEQYRMFGSLGFSGGLMAYWDSKYSWKLYGGIDLKYPLNQLLDLRLSVNQALRIPTYTDLYYESPTHQGNPGLKPEKNTTYQLGMRLESARLTASSMLSYQSGKDIIDWARLNDVMKWQSMNITGLETAGMQLSVSYVHKTDVNSLLSLGSLSLSYRYQQKVKDAGTYYSLYALDFLKHKVDLSLNHTVMHLLVFYWRLGYQQRAGSFFNYELMQEVPYDPVWVADLRATWEKKSIKLFLEGTNLLNRAVFDYGNVPLPGRWIRIGVVATFTPASIKR